MSAKKQHIIQTNIIKITSLLYCKITVFLDTNAICDRIYIIIYAGDIMNSIGLYIHIPFCEQKCPYCDFYSISNKSEYDRYTAAVVNRINELSKKYNRVVSTVYFGGGTPSVLGTDRLISILKSIKSSFLLTTSAEITIEVNPCSSDFLDFNRLKSAGFNRISIGLQSANDNELKALSRRHTAQDAKNTVSIAQGCGFDNISLDLMLCIPNQTKSSLTESIRFCKDCNVQHISAYLLKIEKNTPFYAIKDEIDVFTDEQQAAMYTHAVNELEKYGYKQYEISNFSKENFEGKHNLKYWSDEEYLGIGPSAHSFIDGNRYYYSRSFENFYNNITVVDGSGGNLEEKIMLGLRLKTGLDFENLQNEYNFTLDKNFWQKANLLKREGLVEIDNTNISLTVRGCLVSNSVINYLLNAI